MSMQIDEAGCDDQASRIDLACRGRTGQTADRGDAIAPDPNVALEPRIAGPVDDAAATNQEIIGGLSGADQGRTGR